MFVNKLTLVYGTYNELVFMGFKNQHSQHGDHPVLHWTLLAPCGLSWRARRAKHSEAQRAEFRAEHCGETCPLFDSATAMDPPFEKKHIKSSIYMKFSEIFKHVWVPEANHAAKFQTLSALFIAPREGQINWPDLNIHFGTSAGNHHAIRGPWWYLARKADVSHL
jgi:hypothetical protein